MFISPRLVDSSSELEHKLKDSLAKYDWSHRAESSLDTKNATEKWDKIQTDYQCCGVHSYKDWDPFRSAASSGEYPMSCCSDIATSGQVCDEKAVWSVGCVDQIEGVNAVLTLLLTGLIMMNLVLGVMASIVIFFQPKPGYQRY